MLLLAAASRATRPDYVALAMVLALALIVAVMALRKRFSAGKTVPEIAASPEAAQIPPPAAPGSAGQVKLYDVEPKTAAMLMAIVANRMGKPLNELRFISIREVK